MQRNARALIFTILATLLLGCATSKEMKFKRGKGSVGEFIIAEARAIGGQLLSTNALPALDEEWTIFRDQYGVVLRLPHHSFSNVEALLKAAFGEPRMKPATTTDGGRMGIYRLTSKGGVIQFVQETEWTQVTIIRPLTQDEADDAIIRATKVFIEESYK